jgi:hypothetical protein
MYRCCIDGLIVNGLRRSKGDLLNSPCSPEIETMLKYGFLKEMDLSTKEDGINNKREKIVNKK